MDSTLEGDDCAETVSNFDDKTEFVEIAESVEPEDVVAETVEVTDEISDAVEYEDCEDDLVADALNDELNDPVAQADDDAVIEFVADDVEDFVKEFEFVAKAEVVPLIVLVAHSDMSALVVGVEDIIALRVYVVEGVDEPVDVFETGAATEKKGSAVVEAEFEADTVLRIVRVGVDVSVAVTVERVVKDVEAVDVDEIVGVKVINVDTVSVDTDVCVRVVEGDVDNEDKLDSDLIAELEKCEELVTEFVADAVFVCNPEDDIVAVKVILTELVREGIEEKVPPLGEFEILRSKIVTVGALVIVAVCRADTDED